MKPTTNKNLEMTKVEEEAHLKEWARFLYKLYREHPKIVEIVLEEDK